MPRYTVGVSADDANEDQSGVVSIVAQNGTLVSPANPYVGIRLSSVFRFESLGAVIMQLACDAAKNQDMDADVYCEAADSAATYTTAAFSISTRTRTATKVIWKATMRAGPNVYTTSPDLTPIVMEVMNRPGWVDGNPINFILVARSSLISVFNSQDNPTHVNPPFIDLLPSAPTFDLREAPGHQAPSSAWHTQMFSWQDRGPDVPAYPFADQKPARPVRGFRPLPGKRSETVRPQVNPPVPIQETARFKPLRGFLRRGKSAEVVRAQVNPPYPYNEVVRPKPVRSLLRRGRRSETVRPQVNPPIPVQITQQRKVRGTLRFPGRRAETVRGQVNPPNPVVETVQPRRPRGFLSRRGKSAEVVPTQQVIVPTTLAPTVSSQPRRIRGMLSRRGRMVDPVRSQVNPPYPWAEVRRGKTSLLRRVVRKSETVPPPERPTPFVQQRKVRGGLRFRSRRSEVVQTQAAVAPPALAPSTVSQPRRVRGMLGRRGRVADPVRAQVNPPMPLERRSQPKRLRGMLPRRVRKAETVRGQVNPPYPTETKRQPRRLRGMFTRRTKRNDPISQFVASIPAGSAVVSILGAPAVTITLAGAPSASVAISPAYAATITISPGLSATVTLNGAPSAQID